MGKTTRREAPYANRKDIDYGTNRAAKGSKEIDYVSDNPETDFDPAFEKSTNEKYLAYKVNITGRMGTCSIIDGAASRVTKRYDVTFTLDVAPRKKNRNIDLV
jgi:hypothetical protein